MNEERTDAPSLDLPPIIIGEDALQVGPADVPAEPSAANADAFAMRTSAPKPAPAAKPNKPVSAEANAGVVAALMGKPIPKVTKKPEAKSAVIAAVAKVDPRLPSKRSEETPAVVAMPVSTLDVVEPVATESVIDFGTPAEAETPSAVGATPASPATAESASIAIAEEAGDAGVVPAAEAVIAPEPFVAFELTQTALPENLIATEAVISNVSQPTAEPLAVAFELVKAAEPVAVEIVESVTVVEPVPVVAAPPSTPVLPTVPPIAVVAPAEPRKAFFEPPPAPPKPPAPAIEVKPARRPAAPAGTDRPKRPIPVAPVWPTPAEVAAAQPEPTAETNAPVPRPKAPVNSAPAVVEPELPAGRTGAWWTIPLTFLGIAIVACAVIIPAADDTRRDAYELAKIEQDVDHFQKQSAVNADFLDRVNTDATLAERLAMRQLHQTRAGVKIAPLTGPAADRFGASPFAITQLDPPQPLPPYRPTKSPLGEWFIGDKRPQQMAALGLLIAGIGVLVGGGRRRPAISHPPSA